MPIDHSHQHVSSDIMQVDAPHTPIAGTGGGGVSNPVLEPFAITPAEAGAITPSLTIEAVDPTQNVVRITGAEGQTQAMLFVQTFEEVSVFQIDETGAVQITPPPGSDGIPFLVNAPGSNTEHMAEFNVDGVLATRFGGSDAMGIANLQIVNVAGQSVPLLVVGNSAFRVNDDGSLEIAGGGQSLGFFGGASTQAAAIADATDPASTMARLNDLLAALRAYGLIGS